MEVWRSAWLEVAAIASTAVSLDVHATRDSAVAVPAAVVERLLVNLATNAVRAVASLAGASQIRLVCRGGGADGVLDDPAVVWIHRAEPESAFDRPWVIVELADDGPGFPLGCEREMFRPRWRGRDATRAAKELGAGFNAPDEAASGAGAGRGHAHDHEHEHEPGHGLGLAVCHALAVRWGACLGLVRRAGLGPDGRGARVVLALPIDRTQTHNGVVQ